MRIGEAVSSTNEPHEGLRDHLRSEYVSRYTPWGRTILRFEPLLMNEEGRRSTCPVLCLEYGGPTRCTPQNPNVVRRASIRSDGAVMCHLEASSEADGRRLAGSRRYHADH